MTDQEILAAIRQLQASSGASGNTGAPGSGSDLNYIQGGSPSPDITPTPGGENPMEFFLRSTPGYQFAFNEGLRGVQSSAFAKGTGLTGGTLKAIARYGTGLADQTYNTAVNQRLSLADIGARTAIAPF